MSDSLVTPFLKGQDILDTKLAQIVKEQINPSANDDVKAIRRNLIEPLRNHLRSLLQPNVIDLPVEPCAALLLSDQEIIYASSEGQIHQANLQSMVNKKLSQLPDLEDHKLMFATFIDQNTLFASLGGILRIYDIKSQQYKQYERDTFALPYCGNSDFLYGFDYGSEGLSLTRLNLQEEGADFELIDTSEISFIEPNGFSEDLKYIFLTSKDGQQHKFNLETLENEYSYTTEVMPSCAKLIAGGTQLAIGTKKGEVMIIDDQTQELLKTYKCGKNGVKEIHANEESRRLFIGMENAEMLVFNLDHEQFPPAKLKQQTDPLGYMDIDSKGSKIIFGCANCKQFKIYKIPNTFEDYVYDNELSDTYRIKYYERKRLLFCSDTEGTLNVYRFGEDKSLELIKTKTKNEPIWFDFHQDDQFLHTMFEDESQKFNYRLYDLESENLQLINKAEESKTGSSWQCNEMIVNPQDQTKSVILAAGDGALAYSRYNNGEYSALPHYITIHSITAVTQQNQSEFLIFGEKNGKIKQAKQFSDTAERQFQRHKTRVSALATSNDGKWLFSGSKDGLIKVHNINTGVVLEEIQFIKLVWKLIPKKKRENFDQTILKIESTHDDKFIFIHTEYVLAVIDFNTCTLIWYMLKVKAYHLVGNLLWIATKDKIILKHDVFDQSNIIITGPRGNKYDYLNYIYKIIQGRTPDYKPEFDDWYISKYGIGTLHLYTYFGLPGHVQNALNRNINMIKSQHGVSPLSLALSQNSIFFVQLIVDKLLTMRKDNRFIGLFFKNHLNALNLLGISNIAKVYNSLMVKVQDKRFPEQLSDSVNLPIVQTLESRAELEPKLFFNQEDVDVGQQVELKQFLVPIDSVVGSSGSIDFLSSLSDAPIKDFLGTPFIQNYLEWKWEMVRWVMGTQAAIFFIYTLFLILHIALERNTIMLLIAFILNGVLLAYELYSCVISISTYFLDPNNYTDLIRSGLCIAYTVLYLIDFTSSSNVLLILLICATFYRGISYFSLFQSTRYMVYLIKEVVADMKAFIVILIYSTLGFAVLFLAMDVIDGNQKSFLDYMEMSYNLDLGNYELPEDGIRRIMVFSATIISMVVMFNLLISILGDTFGRVQGEMEQADATLLADMIIEAESLMVWNRSKKDQKFFFLCVEQESSVAGMSIPDRLQAMHNQLNKLYSLNQSSAATLERVYDKLLEAYPEEDEEEWEEEEENEEEAKEPKEE